MTLNGAASAVVIVGGVAEDTIRNVENVIGGSGGDTLSGDGLANVLSGGDGDDTLNGRDGADTLDGGKGADALIGGAQNDVLFGQDGDDALSGGAGEDALDGGAGVDSADYGDKTATVVVTLNGSTNAVVIVGGTAEDTIRNIENVTGGSGADTLSGDGLSNVLRGGLGSDVLDGGAGVDLAVFDDETTSVVMTLNGATNATVFVGGVAEDTIRNVENVIGGSGGDTLSGDGLANVLSGGHGDDTLNGRDGDDTLFGGDGDDVLDGGAGVDLAVFDDKTKSVVVTLNGATNATVFVGGVAEDTIRNIENVSGGSGADTLTGDGLSNVLTGRRGDDTLNGRDGDDTLFGGDGADVLRGGGGNDTLDGGASPGAYSPDSADYGDKTASVVVTLNGAADATVFVGGVAEDTIRNIESVTGGSGDDTLTGDASINFFRGGAGADTLDGGAGEDAADNSDKTASVVVTLNGAADATVFVGGVAEDTIRNIEDIIGGSGNDILTGDGLANVLVGRDGDDILKGGAGADSLDGEAGVDTVDYSDKTLSVAVALASGITGVTVGGVLEDAIIGFENVIGGSGDDTLTGDDSANVFRGGAGADTLDGGGGGGGHGRLQRQDHTSRRDLERRGGCDCDGRRRRRGHDPQH